MQDYCERQSWDLSWFITKWWSCSMRAAICLLSNWDGLSLSLLSSVALDSRLIPCGKPLWGCETDCGWFPPVTATATSFNWSQLWGAVYWRTNRLLCFTCCVLISCSSSFDFYSQAYWQVKSLILVAQIATLTPPKILESIKAAEYCLYCFRFLRISLHMIVVLKY